ncbi:Mitochondrial fission ELM1 [seawater metagenome]|uniref:Mitochondrial fission ELM1 n=1 Tax=seawater metagenome TaxID=1561972 RepID=A0A5E8CLW6_9ZZZZ
MKILSICSVEYNYQQAKGIIKWLNGDNESMVLKIPNIKNIIVSYLLLFLYFTIFRCYKFVHFEKDFDVVIVTGKSVIAQSIILAHQLNVPICSVQKPFGFPSYLFKYQFIPYHDIKGEPSGNQIPTLIAPNSLEYVDSKTREKTISLFIGGEVHGKKFDSEPVLNTINVIKNNIKDFQLNIVTSRRTPNDLIEKIKDIDNTYDSYMDAINKSQIIIVSDDSFCMISEVIQTGLKPYIITTNNSTPKLKNGIEKLLEYNLINFFTTYDNLKFLPINRKEYDNIFGNFSKLF